MSVKTKGFEFGCQLSADKLKADKTHPGGKANDTPHPDGLFFSG
jgi:hypothetical protein